MTERVKKQLDFLKRREYRNCRNQEPAEDVTQENAGYSKMERKRRLFVKAAEAENPLFYGEDIIGFNRYQSALPYDRAIELSGNMTVDYDAFLREGLFGIREKIRLNYEKTDGEGRFFYDEALQCLSAAQKLAEKYRDEAKKTGRTALYNALLRVPFYGARDYYEAILSVKFLIYILKLNHNSHVTLGRYDFYMRPYYFRSLENGAKKEELDELTQLFFISLNFDADLYSVVQLGDNGQSLILGGCDFDGKETYDEFSKACLFASEMLCLIDPKINIRVSKSTPLSVYEAGTRLTKQGLGFPQYSNDDVVVPGLVALGYDLRDARNYSVAACWEFIPSGCGADWPNIHVMNYPLVVEKATEKYLLSSETFEEFMENVCEELIAYCEKIRADRKNYRHASDPLLSLFISPCIERGRDISALGAKYNNFGIHGAGISTAADSLEAIERAVYLDKIVTKEELLKALSDNFKGHEALREQLLAYPKMGNNEDSVDGKAAILMECFAENMNGKPNSCGGVFRAGTGSAHEYIWSAKNVGATADGRKAKEPFGSSYAPSLQAKLNGPLSAVLSFTKFDLKKTINGGPFTIEIHDTVFRNEEGEKKVAMLVKSFIDRGGHQIQINSINRDVLLEAQKHPEQYRNLIVRVWGWSGYFTELDAVYQNHVIKRTEFTV